ncbi:GntR family transcriptional regulator [Paracidovorax anthurii]|uniref:DNA-binding GntR family transcriptional regulator n=1 Tax=Paracidovorax anthurii TaxID=78229 RepID=A0A328ZG44_9BURK|nr:GntR family transcriptional regulator [Paracidovorax anthurii]RAR84345.1 DNA-binding GntR family transcriptional regulator [Paracidovorax anthurii]WCM93007.1 GntR family transcriptional regulator [Acidovorax sp. NCPPB 2350]
MNEEGNFAPAGAIETADKARAPGTSLSDQVYESVRRMIFDFELMPGGRFSEAELTERLGVSRTPLRQALQRLESQGFVRVLPKMGWYVAPIDFDVMDELYDLRILIECHAIEHLAADPDTPPLRALQEIWLVPAGERLADGIRVGALDEDFHACLVAAAGNREMMRVHAEVTDRIRLIRRLDFTKPARIDATYDEHGTILRAVLARRRDEALRLLRTHIEQSKLEVRKITLEALYRARQAGS